MTSYIKFERFLCEELKIRLKFHLFNFYFFQHPTFSQPKGLS